MPAMEIDGKAVSFKIEDDAVVVAGSRLQFEILSAEEGRLLVKVGATVREIIYSENGSGLELFSGSASRRLEVFSDRDLLLRSLSSGGADHHVHAEIKAPMPGLVVRTLVKEGDAIKRGSKLLILEAMKMENEIKAPVDAVVGEILVHEGDVVEKDQRVIILR